METNGCIAKRVPISDVAVDEELLLRQITKMVFDRGLLTGRVCPDRDPVINFHHPHQLKELVNLSLGDRCSDHEEIVRLCSQAIDYSVRTTHPHFANLLFHGVDPIGLAGTWLSEALNTNAHTYEVAPFFLMVEEAVLQHMRSFIGWTDDGDGLFTPGGSMSNMMAMVLARFVKFPQIKTKGWNAVNGQPVAFTSQDGHYSFKKAANWMGLGTDNLILVKTDETGRMIPTELEREIRKAIEAGQTPFFVGATAGTTVLGSFDPIEELADICSQHGLWLHVDASWGGGALVSRKYRSLMKGIERVDSVAWNAHKMLCAPLTCATFLVKRKGLLEECNTANASYLFQQDKFYDVSYDSVGDKGFQCGRKADAFKLWLMWKARGDTGLEQLVDNAFDCARYLQQRISKMDNFRPVLDEINCTNVCFWYIPPRFRHRSDAESPEWWQEISKVAPEIKKRMMEKGSMMVAYQPMAQKGWVNFFRMVVPSQPALTHADMDFIVDEIERLGSEL